MAGYRRSVLGPLVSDRVDLLRRGHPPRADRGSHPWQSGLARSPVGFCRADARRATPIDGDRLTVDAMEPAADNVSLVLDYISAERVQDSWRAPIFRIDAARAFQFHGTTGAGIPDYDFERKMPRTRVLDRTEHLPASRYV